MGGRQIDSYQELFYTGKESFEARGAQIHMETPVTEVDFANKVVHCRKLDGTTFQESYDKLILATGLLPISSNLPGINFLKLFQEGQEVDRQISDSAVKKVAVTGAGYTGVEIAEAARRRGKEVLLFDVAPCSLATYYDTWFTGDMDQNLRDHGIETHFSEGATAYIGTDRVEAIETAKGRYDVDMVINAICFVPNSELGRDHLDCLSNGAYRVGRHQRTSDPDVYAIGDCASLYSNALRGETYIALAASAVRSGIVAGHNVGVTPLEAAGVQGSNGISIFGLRMVSTGLSVKAAEKNGLKVKYSDFEDLQRPSFMKENSKVKIRLVCEAESRRLVGAHMASREDISMAIHLFSLAVAEGVTADKLKLLDIFFLPRFSQPYNYITMAALKAE